ncbi:MAG: L-2-amino-thiazoline-4-carboxylic acid hydrolase [Erysipelotrichaceae bacterium]|nr:L-2-amino-thiazoline-4-carboxylic acid hydrolase [Erysipelotrichaceae bacterium]
MEIREHALLYAFICRSILDNHSKEEAEDLIKKITVSYGHKRGERMRSNSDTGDLTDFFINGEWKGKEGENISSLRAEDGRTVSEVKKCAWYDTWKENGLLEYGTYYCRCIDRSICDGYGSSFSLDVRKTKGQGDDECLFVWDESYDQKRLEESERKHILDFDFHCKELLDTAMEIIEDENIKKEIAQIYEGLSQ